MVKESDMELMNWLCPECGLELHKHLTEIICPVSDVDAPGPDEKICLKCKWNNGISGYSQVCAYALHGGETLYIRDGKPRGKCLLEDAPEPSEEYMGPVAESMLSPKAPRYDKVYHEGVKWLDSLAEKGG